MATKFHAADTGQLLAMMSSSGGAPTCILRERWGARLDAQTELRHERRHVQCAREMTA